MGAEHGVLRSHLAALNAGGAGGGLGESSLHQISAHRRCFPSGTPFCPCSLGCRRVRGAFICSLKPGLRPDNSLQHRCWCGRTQEAKSLVASHSPAKQEQSLEESDAFISVCSHVRRCQSGSCQGCGLCHGLLTSPSNEPCAILAAPEGLQQRAVEKASCSCLK